MKLEKYAKSVTYCYVVGLFAVAMLPINGKDSQINSTYVLSEIRLDYFMHSLLLIPWVPLRLIYKRTDKQQLFFWFLIGLLLAILSEFVQYFLPYRTYNVIDLVANVFGVFVGLLLWRVFVAIFG